MQLSRSQGLTGRALPCLHDNRCIGAGRPVPWRIRRKPSARALKRGSSSNDDAQDANEVITFITSDGLVKLPRWQSPSQIAKLKQRLPLPTWQEQGLCIGNSFWVTATNGLDICRRLNLIGYCRCTEMLSDVVEHTVLSSGGEIIIRKHKSSSTAIITGGGYVEKVYRQWQMYGK